MDAALHFFHFKIYTCSVVSDVILVYGVRHLCYYLCCLCTYLWKQCFKCSSLWDFGHFPWQQLTDIKAGIARRSTVNFNRTLLTHHRPVQPMGKMEAS